MAGEPDLYRKKLTTPQEAPARVPAKASVSFGLGPSNPPALLSAPADRVEARHVEEIPLDYQFAKQRAKPLFRTDYPGRLHFHALFPSDVDRMLIKEAGTPAAVDFMPSYFRQLLRVEHVRAIVFPGWEFRRNSVPGERLPPQPYHRSTFPVACGIVEPSHRLNRRNL